MTANEPQEAPLNDAQKSLLGGLVTRTRAALGEGPAKQAAVERGGAQIRDMLVELRVPTETSGDVLAVLAGVNFVVANAVEAMRHDESIPFHLRVGIERQLNAIVAAVMYGTGATFTSNPPPPEDLPAWIAEQKRLRDAEREMEGREG